MIRGRGRGRGRGRILAKKSKQDFADAEALGLFVEENLTTYRFQHYYGHDYWLMVGRAV